MRSISKRRILEQPGITSKADYFPCILLIKFDVLASPLHPNNVHDKELYTNRDDEY